MSHVIVAIRRELKNLADEKTKKSGLAFFKEKIRLYGVKTPVVDRIAKEYYKKIQNTSKTKLFALCKELWMSGMMEESFIACHWSYSVRKDYEPQDFKVFENWIERYVGNWASCDTLCNHTLGAFLERYPDHVSNLLKWCESPNRWMRRAAAVSLIIPVKQGKFLETVFEIADRLLLDQDDLVQKGYGWLLKEASRTGQKKVYDYVMKNKKVMPRTALRYAIEKMPKELKAQCMEK